MRPFAPKRGLAVIGLVAAACTAGSPPPATPTPTTANVSPAPTAAVTPAPTGLAISAGGILGALPQEPTGTSWVRISDPAAPLTFEVPSLWSSVAAGPWDEGGGTIGYVLAGATDTSKLGFDFTASGAAIGASANPTGLNPRAIVEGDDYSDRCTGGPAEEAIDPTYQAVYKLWESCGTAGTGFLLSMVVAPAGGGLLGVIFQGSSQQDMAYLEHVLASILPVEPTVTPGRVVTPEPGQVTPAPGTGDPYTITMDICQNQHGQGVAEGYITNNDSVSHSYRIVVRFYDPNGAFLNDAGSFNSPEVRPGETYRWQSVVPSGLPGVPVSCEVSEVQIVF